jgi:hypothetical protein
MSKQIFLIWNAKGGATSSLGIFALTHGISRGDCVLKAMMSRDAG